MGEIADMMLDGTLCEGCGVPLLHGPDGEPSGHPQYCSDQCARDRGQLPDLDVAEGSGQFFVCDICDKRLRTVEGVEQHKRAKHGENEKDKT